MAADRGSFLNEFIATPLREGHLRLPRVPGIDLWVGAAGLIALILLMGLLVIGPQIADEPSILLEERSEDIFGVNPELRAPVWSFYMLGAAFGVAWLMMLWGIASVVAWLRISSAIAFFFINVQLVSVIGSRLALSALALSAFLLLAAPLLRERRNPLLLLGFVVTTGAFGTIWGAQTVSVLSSRPDPDLVDELLGALDLVILLQLPLAIISTLALAHFNFRLAEVGTGLFSRLPEVAWKVAVPMIAILKLASYLTVQREPWLSWVRGFPAARVAVPMGAFSAAALAIAFLVRRVRGAPEAERVRETFTYAAPLFLVLPMLPGLVFSGLAALFRMFGAGELPTPPGGLLAAFFFGGIAVFVIGGTFVLIRNRGISRRFLLGMGAALMGLWLIALIPVPVGLDSDLALIRTRQVLDVSVTVVVCLLATVFWSRLSRLPALYLIGVLLFGWLLAANLRLLSDTVDTLALPAVSIAIVAVVYSLIADSGFVNRGGRLLTGRSRTFLWLGYLILSLALAGWGELAGLNDIAPGSAHASPTQEFPVFFLLFQIPFIFWLASSHRFGDRQRLEEETLREDRAPQRGRRPAKPESG